MVLGWLTSVLQRIMVFSVMAILVPMACSSPGVQAPPVAQASTPIPPPSAPGAATFPEWSQKPAEGGGLMVPPSSQDSDKSQLAVVLSNQWVFIKNGGRVELGNGLSLELFLDPYPPKRLREYLDMYLSRNGEPVTDAEAGITYDMLGMFHGPFDFAAKNLRDGHYLFALDYIMFGAWEHQLVVSSPQDHYELAVGIVVFPTSLP